MTTKIRETLRDIIEGCQVPSSAIHITPLQRGYKLDIGCATFAFEELGAMMEALNLYLDDPKDAEIAYNEHMSELVGVSAPPPDQPEYQYHITGGGAASPITACEVAGERIIGR